VRGKLGRPLPLRWIIKKIGATNQGQEQHNRHSATSAQHSRNGKAKQYSE
jgi:hypothetical protein